MFSGVSTSCFYPQLTEEAFDFLAQQNVKAVEIFLNCEYEISPQFLKEVKKKAEEYQIHIVSLHPYTSGEEGRMFFGLYDRRTQESREIYKKYYEACTLLGVQSLVFHGDRFAGLSWETYIQRFAMLLEDAKKYGVHLCLENVFQFRSASPKLFKKTKSLLPQAKFVLDTKQAVLSGYDPLEFVEAMGSESIHHIHISDHNRELEKACMLPGTGTFDMQGFVSALEGKGYQGGLILELYRRNYKDKEDVIKGYEYLTSLLLAEKT